MGRRRVVVEEVMVVEMQPASSALRYLASGTHGRQDDVVVPVGRLHPRALQRGRGVGVVVVEVMVLLLLLLLMVLLCGCGVGPKGLEIVDRLDLLVDNASS